jgi:hypothetical protein
MKVFIAVLSCNNCTTYTTLKAAQKATWAKPLPETKIVFYHGAKRKSTKDTEDEWFFSTPENYKSIGHKTILAFERSLQYDYDYLFRPNSSLYVNQIKLLEWLSDKPRTAFATGINGIGSDNILYLHGSGYILSRDIIELIVKNKDEWKHKYIDDIAMSELIGRKGIVFDRNFIATGIQIKGSRFEWWQNNKCLVTIGAVDKFEQMTFLKDHFHFRVNNAPDRHKDIKLMRLLNDYLK